MFVESDEKDDLKELVNDLWTMHDTLTDDGYEDEDDLSAGLDDED